ncbi:unnamed protein product [Urochloa humidicola]
MPRRRVRPPEPDTAWPLDLGGVSSAHGVAARSGRHSRPGRRFPTLEALRAAPWGWPPPSTPVPRGDHGACPAGECACGGGGPTSSSAAGSGRRDWRRRSRSTAAWARAASPTVDLGVLPRSPRSNFFVEQEPPRQYRWRQGLVDEAAVAPLPGPTWWQRRAWTGPASGAARRPRLPPAVCVPASWCVTRG